MEVTFGCCQTPTSTAEKERVLARPRSPCNARGCRAGGPYALETAELTTGSTGDQGQQLHTQMYSPQKHSFTVPSSGRSTF